MSNPTELILGLSFLFAAVLFTAAATARLAFGRKRTEPPPLPEREEAPEPYDPPEQEVIPPPLPAGQIPTWFYRPLDFLWMGFIFAVFAWLSLQTAKATGNAAGDVKIDAEVLVASMTFQLVLAGVTVGIVWLRVNPSAWLGLRWRKWPLVFLVAPLAVGSMWVVFGALQAAGYMRLMETLGGESMQESVKLLQNSTDPRTLGLMALAAVVVAPVCEEVVFRGYLYPAAKRFAGPWVAGICTALVFAAAHGNLMALLPLFLFGGVLVLLYEKTGSLWAPVAAHFCFNGLTVAAQLAVRYYDIPLQTP